MFTLLSLPPLFPDDEREGRDGEQRVAHLEEEPPADDRARRRKLWKGEDDDKIKSFFTF